LIEGNSFVLAGGSLYEATILDRKLAIWEWLFLFAGKKRDFTPGAAGG